MTWKSELQAFLYERMQHRLAPYVHNRFTSSWEAHCTVAKLIEKNLKNTCGLVKIGAQDLSCTSTLKNIELFHVELMSLSSAFRE